MKEELLGVASRGPYRGRGTSRRGKKGKGERGRESWMTAGTRSIGGRGRERAAPGRPGLTPRSSTRTRKQKTGKNARGRGRERSAAANQREGQSPDAPVRFVRFHHVITSTARKSIFLLLFRVHTLMTKRCVILLPFLLPRASSNVNLKPRTGPPPEWTTLLTSALFHQPAHGTLLP